jgi:hypothetical protein
LDDDGSPVGEEVSDGAGRRLHLGRFALEEFEVGLWLKLVDFRLYRGVTREGDGSSTLGVAD